MSARDPCSQVNMPELSPPTVTVLNCNATAKDGALSAMAARPRGNGTVVAMGGRYVP